MFVFGVLLTLLSGLCRIPIMAQGAAPHTLRENPPVTHQPGPKRAHAIPSPGLIHGPDPNLGKGGKNVEIQNAKSPRLLCPCNPFNFISVLRSHRSSRRHYSRSRSRSHRRRSRSHSNSQEYRRRRSHSHSPMSNRRRHVGNRVCENKNSEVV